MTHSFQKIIIVGAGPAGLLLALLLGKHGIPAHVLEASDGLDLTPRANYYETACVPDLERAGILSEMRRRGFTPGIMSWRRFGGQYESIARLDTSVLQDVDGHDLRAVCLPMRELLELLLENVEMGDVASFVSISWGHEVVRVRQDGGKAWVEVKRRGDNQVLVIDGDYVVGCDGASSIVRKSMFSGAKDSDSESVHFPGFTWDTQIVATDVVYPDLETKFGFGHGNFVMHPEHFFVAAKLPTPGLYRIAYGEALGLTSEQLRDRLPAKFEAMLPGSPKPGDYTVSHFAPYKIHQRCALSFRKGRVLLAADAAHVCNPFGGLGITGGFVDVGGLYDIFAAIWDGKVVDKDVDAILDLYSEKRREKWHQVIDHVSQDNFRRATGRELLPGSMPSAEFEVMLPAVAADADLRRKILLMGLGMRYDFTQHYTVKS